MYDHFKSIDDFLLMLHEEDIENYKSYPSSHFSWELSLDSDSFLKLVRKNNSIIFWHVIKSDFEDFLISCDDFQDILEFPSIHFKNFFEEKIKIYNETISVQEDFIDIPYEILLFTNINNIKIFSIINLDVKIEYPDYTDTVNKIFNDSLHEYDNNRKETLRNKEQSMEKLENFLINDPVFTTLKNEVLRREYLNKLEYKNPEIYRLFKHSQFPGNPIVHLNAIYQKHKKAGQSN